MSEREEWRKVLDSEVQRWSAMSCDHLVFELRNLQAYAVELDSKKYQVEVELWRKLTNTFTSWWPLTTEAFRHPSHR